ncbi:hypothetical protein KIPB_014884, partial [Kipferlia bialata]|eukprot:g14884.t1
MCVFADSPFDHLLGESSGAGALFGATGGVMEAALRTAYEIATKTPLPTLEFTPIRGQNDIKEAEIEMTLPSGDKK